VPLLAAGSWLEMVVTWLAAVFLLGWALLFALGIGLFRCRRRQPRPPPQERSGGHGSPDRGRATGAAPAPT
jgi:hypothetical protein